MRKRLMKKRILRICTRKIKCQENIQIVFFSFKNFPLNMSKRCKRICFTKICALDIKFSANVSNIRRHADTQLAYFLYKRIKLNCLLTLLIFDKIYTVDLKSFFVIHVPWNTNTTVTSKDYPLRSMGSRRLQNVTVCLSQCSSLLQIWWTTWNILLAKQVKLPLNPLAPIMG